MTEANLVQEGEFEEIKETELGNESGEMSVETPQEEKPQVDKGVLIFQLEDGSTSHSMIGEVSLENMTYFSRYLSLIEEKHWEERMNTPEEGE